MIIRSVRHRGLLRIIEDDDGRELRSDLVRRLRNILAVLIAALVETWAALSTPTSAAHQLKGDRAGRGAFRSAALVATFDIAQGDVCNLDLEDYH